MNIIDIVHRSIVIYILRQLENYCILNLGISSQAVAIGLRNNLLPIGFAIHNEERDRRFTESWSYHIIAERMISYNHGKLSEIRVENIETSLDKIIEEFNGLKQDLLFILSENAEVNN